MVKVEEGHLSHYFNHLQLNKIFPAPNMIVRRIKQDLSYTKIGSFVHQKMIVLTPDNSQLHYSLYRINYRLLTGYSPISVN